MTAETGPVETSPESENIPARRKRFDRQFAGFILTRLVLFTTINIALHTIVNELMEQKDDNATVAAAIHAADCSRAADAEQTLSAKTCEDLDDISDSNANDYQWKLESIVLIAANTALTVQTVRRFRTSHEFAEMARAQFAGTDERLQRLEETAGFEPPLT